MAHKPISFRLDEKKKAIIRYSNVSMPVAEKELFDMYRAEGYKILLEDKNEDKKITVSSMREDLKDDKEALKEFNRRYKLKEDKEHLDKNGKPLSGFHSATQYYNSWKKEHKE